MRLIGAGTDPSKVGLGPWNINPGSWHGHFIDLDGYYSYDEDHLPQLLEVEEVIGYWSDNEDRYEGMCVAVVKLKNGAYLGWETFWGPTGHGFSEDAYGGDCDVFVARTKEFVFRMGLTDDGRERLGLPGTAYKPLSEIQKDLERILGS